MLREKSCFENYTLRVLKLANNLMWWLKTFSHETGHLRSGGYKTLLSFMMWSHSKASWGCKFYECMYYCNQTCKFLDPILFLTQLNLVRYSRLFSMGFLTCRLALYKKHLIQRVVALVPTCCQTETCIFIWSAMTINLFSCNNIIIFWIQSDVSIIAKSRIPPHWNTVQHLRYN